jgi:sugar O-acyltransferase (sialic acid O-acetyltransferase NeuD family)
MDNGDNRIVLVGAGGHAKSVVAVLHAERKWQVAAIIEDAVDGPGKTVLGHEVLGDRSRLPELRRAGVDKGFVAIGDNRARCRLAEVLLEGGFNVICVMHPAAVCMVDASIGAGSFLHAFAIVGPECRVGRNAIVQPFTSLGHESRVGDGVQFSPGVHVGGKVRIGDHCFFGPGAVVFPGITIGRNVAVGANSVVNKDVDDDMVVAGSPARFIRRNDTMR